MGGTSNDSSSSSSSMSPLSSPSSIVYVDLYGKRRQIAKVQVLEREIGLIQEEIKSLGEVELASRCCKEIDEYVEVTPDPLIALNQIRNRSRNFWKNLRRKIGSMLCCCGCCKTTTICCSCRSAADGGCCCCSGHQEKTRTPERCNCPRISCHCSCKPSCPKCSVCCCKPCSCF
ncbi:guanine nucleotide-binding protein subunit gamma 3-like isoform X2 [Cynara cardunculus var. scolymus]|uniref:guanine nucleotide-binding protein subunit gamma 3-like isoform X2 n=1 Tax=Cynara cardunculus var. scolymus TaxID=59895 RepID=UPI000D624DC0|nr:guanine nucleotide-binding protein subunit gamma 3-like isoform X2 [Cynara cardunculus var. scolymus]